MKRVVLYINLLILCASFGSFYAGALIDTLEKVIPTAEPIFVGVVQEKQKQLAELQQEKDVFVQEEKKFEQSIKDQLDEANAQRTVVENQLKENPDDAFLKAELSILNELYQVLKDTQRTREKLVELIDDFVKLLSDFLQDPEFEAFKKEKKLYERTYYTFEDLQRTHEAILDQEKRIAQFAEQEKTASADREGRKRIVTSIAEAFKKKQEEHQRFISGVSERTGDEAQLEPESKIELFDLEEKLYSNKKVLHELRLKEIEHKIAYLGVQSLVAKKHLDILKKYFEKIKPLIRISEVDITLAKNELVKEKQHYYATKDSYSQQMDKLQKQEKKQEQELTKLSAKYNVPLGRDLDEWMREPKQTVDTIVGLYEVGTANTNYILINKKQELLDVQAASEDEKINFKKLLVDVKESYYKIIVRKFLSEEEIKRETSKYDTVKVETKASIARYQEKINNVADQLSQQKKVLDNIKARRDEVQKLKDTIFKDHQKEYAQCLELLNRTEEHVKEQIDILSKMTGAYSGIISVIKRSEQLINMIKAELAIGSIWYRTEDTIKWDEVKNIIPDTLRFFSDVRSYLTKFDLSTLVRIRDSFRTLSQLIIFILKLLALFLGLLFLWWYTPSFTRKLSQLSEQYKGVARIISLLVVVMLDFYYTYFIGILLWSLLFAALFFHVIPDAYLYILFYLFSIPYLLYLAYRFIRNFIHFNQRHEYVFLAADFQRRFTMVFSTLVYATIAIFFFREAFMLANYYQSNLPTILLAMNFIVFQISLIFLIAKEQILNIIPQKNQLWIWIGQQVDRYYYLILLGVLAVIIMSNPYVGFGRLVLHILIGIVYTVLLLICLLWIHGFFKRVISRIFFSTEEEVVRERFANAKTWFGFLIIASFVVISFIGFIIGVNIWGWLWDWTIHVQDVFGWLNTPMLQKDTAHPISVLSVLQIIGFILAGFLASFALNRFVLDKIFNLLLVDPGVQNTITRISRYIIVIIAIFLGFSNVGLGQLVTVVVAGLGLSIGWVLKEPISDFIAYFIILVQRPIKIGDYIKVDAEIMGIVRKITPRSVVLRRKNSTTIVVPNSDVISKPIVNWNYARNFIAFDDIEVTVNYKADPTQVKEILFQVISSHPNILRNPKPIIRLDALSEYGFKFMIRGFISAAYTLEQWDVASDVRLGVVKALRDANIQLALPVRMIVGNTGNGMKKLTQE